MARYLPLYAIPLLPLLILSTGLPSVWVVAQADPLSALGSLGLPWTLLAGMIAFWWRREVVLRAKIDEVQAKCDTQLQTNQKDYWTQLQLERTKYDTSIANERKTWDDRIEGILRIRQRDQQNLTELLGEINVRLADANIFSDFCREAMLELERQPPDKRKRRIDEVLESTLTRKRQRDKAHDED